MLFDKGSKFVPIADFARLRGLPDLWLDRSGFGFALHPQVNRIATDPKQLARLTFLKTVQLNRVHHLLPEIITIGLSHWTRVHYGNSYSLRPNLIGYSYILRRSSWSESAHTGQGNIAVNLQVAIAAVLVRSRS